MLAVLLLAACSPGHECRDGSGKDLDERAASADGSSDLSAGEKIAWTRFGFDPARSGVNPEEKLLTPATVGDLLRLWHTQLPGVADSSPIPCTI